jgi:hypothetical protein
MADKTPIYVQVQWDDEDNIVVYQNPPDSPERLVDAIRVLAMTLQRYGDETRPGPKVLGQIVETSLQQGIDQLRFLVNKEKPALQEEPK